ncbi:MAG: YaiI/YqxD family protein [Deltaproteobacteria bacterium]|nr:YaiI/YqxD family protein [Deltaproteobacteria bacterium]
MKIWIDGDGAPGAIKDMLFRAAERRAIDTVIVANRLLNVPRHPRIKAVKVDRGFDVADDWLVANAQPGDLVVTSDVPLAAALVAKGVEALSFRGELFTAANAKVRLAERDRVTEAREAGLVLGGGPPPFDARAGTAFANAFDRWLTAAQRRSST